MQALILAAGMGNRLGKYTKQNTKCMLEINGKTLIERTLDALEANSITRCIIVVGYQKQNLMDFVGSRYKSISIEYVHNDIYDKTNNIYSLYLAKDKLLEDDTILLESDLIFEDRIVTDLLAAREPTLAVVDRYESWMDGTVVKVNSESVITQFIPKRFFDYNERSSYYKTVNIYKFSREFLEQTYVPFLEAYSKAMGCNDYYEQVLRVITTLEKNELKAFCLTGHKWYEIDDVQDKDIAECLFANNPVDRLDRFQRRYGGYWRFPQMLDYCYLVNPYFPTPVMESEIQAYFHDILSQYPSGLGVQNLLAGKMLGVDESRVLVGNGAAELIRALASVVRGTVGVVYPTFNEYPESLEGCEIKPFLPSGGRYDVDDLIAWSADCDNLLLINPDNPSGNLIPREGVLRLLDSMSQRGKRLILDESFLDFADDGFAQSLATDEILTKYPGLIIVKSVSKSYGVPGIRLGILACGDPSTIASLRKRLSIWNINSFGEYFLQIIGKYKKEYAEACRRIRAERDRFRLGLEALGWITVLPSQANYFMCHVNGKLNARQLAELLLDQKNVLIKDLTGKKGIEGDRWIRLAVRSGTDNDRLLEFLRALG